MTDKRRIRSSSSFCAKIADIIKEKGTKLHLNRKDFIMKRNKKPIVLSIVVVAVAIVILIISFSRIPKSTPRVQVEQYLTEHYPNLQVKKIEKYKEEEKRYYSYRTDDGRDITFTITWDDGTISDDLGENINIYISRTYAGTDVTGWSHDKIVQFLQKIQKEVDGIQDNYGIEHNYSNLYVILCYNGEDFPIFFDEKEGAPEVLPERMPQ